MKMKNASIYSLFVLLLFSSCIQESPLSDVELDDPSLIAPTLKLEKETEGGINTSLIEVWLFDRNFNSFVLKNGSLRLNKIPMELQRTDAALVASGLPYYDCAALGDVKHNTTYTLEVVLSNKETYTASIKTPAMDLGLVLPESFDPDKGFEISWDNSTQYDEMEFSIWQYYGSGDSDGQSGRSSSIPIPLSDRQAGRYLVTSQSIKDAVPTVAEGETAPEIEKLRVSLSASISKSAVIDERFHENGEAEVTYTESGFVNSGASN
jgi:hypothetical protein